MTPRWTSVSDAASLLGCSVRTIERRIARGDLTVRRTNGAREVQVDVTDDATDTVSVISHQADLIERLGVLASRPVDAAEASAHRSRVVAGVSVTALVVVLIVGVAGIWYGTRKVTLAEAKVTYMGQKLVGISDDLTYAVSELEQTHKQLSAQRSKTDALSDKLVETAARAMQMRFVDLSVTDNIGDTAGLGFARPVMVNSSMSDTRVGQ